MDITTLTRDMESFYKLNPRLQLDDLCYDEEKGFYSKNSLFDLCDAIFSQTIEDNDKGAIPRLNEMQIQLNELIKNKESKIKHINKLSKEIRNVSTQFQKLQDELFCYRFNNDFKYVHESWKSLESAYQTHIFNEFNKIVVNRDINDIFLPNEEQRKKTRQDYQIISGQFKQIDLLYQNKDNYIEFFNKCNSLLNNPTKQSTRVERFIKNMIPEWKNFFSKLSFQNDLKDLLKITQAYLMFDINEISKIKKINLDNHKHIIKVLNLTCDKIKNKKTSLLLDKNYYHIQNNNDIVLQNEIRLRKTDSFLKCYLKLLESVRDNFDNFESHPPLIKEIIKKFKENPYPIYSKEEIVIHNMNLLPPEDQKITLNGIKQIQQNKIKNIDDNITSLETSFNKLTSENQEKEKINFNNTIREALHSFNETLNTYTKYRTGLDSVELQTVCDKLLQSMNDGITSLTKYSKKFNDITSEKKDKKEKTKKKKKRSLSLKRKNKKMNSINNQINNIS